MTGVTYLQQFIARLDARVLGSWVIVVQGQNKNRHLLPILITNQRQAKTGLAPRNGHLQDLAAQIAILFHRVPTCNRHQTAMKAPSETQSCEVADLLDIESVWLSSSSSSSPSWLRPLLRSNELDLLDCRD